MSNSHLSCAVIIATVYRYEPLKQSLEHLSRQERLPELVIVADGAPEPGVEPFIMEMEKDLKYPVKYYRCSRSGAAAQRNEAAELVTQDVILFMDDDLYMESGCLNTMIEVLEKDISQEIGGVGVILTNQHYCQPSRLFKKWLDFMAGENADSYAGRVIGPAINILPAPSSDGRIVEVEWLNTGCTAYRREVFEAERFSSRFYGYSMLEDVHLSLRIAKQWKLVVATAAQAFHDSQPSQFKQPFEVGKMSVINRYLVMTEVMERKNFTYHYKLILSILFGLFSSLRNIGSISDFWNFFLLSIGIASGFFRTVLRVKGY